MDIGARLATETAVVGSEDDLTVKRREYHASRTGSAMLTSFDEGVKFKCVRGPIGNGKSVLMCIYIVYKSQQQSIVEISERGKKLRVRWSKWLIMRHTFKALNETTIETWNQWFGDKTRWVSNPLEGRYEDWVDGVLVRIDFVCHASESRNIRNDLQSLELSGAWINEATQCPFEIIGLVYSRLKRFNPAPKAGVEMKHFHVIMDSNSPNETNWWRRMEEIEQPDGWLFFVCPPAVLEERNSAGRSVYVPNDEEHARKHHRRPAENVREIDGGYHKGLTYWTDMVSVLDEDGIRTLLMNQFGLNVAGLGVFSDVWNPQRHVAQECELPYLRGLPLVAGMDLGRTPAMAIGQIQPDGRLAVIDEVTTWNEKLNNGRGGLDRTDVVTFFDRFALPLLANRYNYPNCSLAVFADPAGKNFNEVVSISAIQRLHEERGLNIVACDKVQSASGDYDITNGNNTDVRISAVTSELRSGMLVISDRCRLLKEAMSGKYCYEKRRDNGAGVQYRDFPCKNEWSHISDALQYLVLAVFKGAIDFGRTSSADDSARWMGLTGGEIGCI